MKGNYIRESRDISRILGQSASQVKVRSLPMQVSPYGIPFTSKGMIVPSVEERAITSGAHDVERVSYILSEFNEAYKRFCGSDGKLHPALIVMDIRRNGLRLSEDAVNVLSESNFFDKEFLRANLPVQVHGPMNLYK
jgi:hypothetical protein